LIAEVMAAYLKASQNKASFASHLSRRLRTPSSNGGAIRRLRKSTTLLAPST
jgi:hypothetical protein